MTVSLESKCFRKAGPPDNPIWERESLLVHGYYECELTLDEPTRAEFLKELSCEVGFFMPPKFLFSLFSPFPLSGAPICRFWQRLSQDWGLSWKNYPREGPLRRQPNLSLVCPLSSGDRALPPGTNGSLGFEVPPGLAAPL